VVDSPQGSRLEQAEAPPQPRQLTFTTVVHGWPEDAERWLESVLQHHLGYDFEVLLVDNSGAETVDRWMRSAAGHERVRSLRLDPPVGFGAAVNAGLAAATGQFVVLFDPGTQATGDVAGALLDALARPGVGIAAAFGVRGAGTMKEFAQHPGPEVDAAEGYCMAFRREDALAVGGFDEKFRFYRIADFEFSFRIRSTGKQVIVVAGLPVARHAHRLWEAESAPERERLSKKNFYRFLNRWGKRTDLLVAGEEPAPKPR
jgi:GT2 family glycosyltransferase